MADQSVSDFYLKKLEEFEKKYGVAWVENKYSTAPKADNPYYDFAMKMHSVYIFRKTGTERDKLVLEDAMKAKRPSERPQRFRGFDVSPQLQASLSGFNGGRGGKTGSPEEFYDKWLYWKSGRAKSNQKVKRVVEEGIEKKAEVMLMIAHFFSTRHLKITDPKKIKVRKR